MPARAGELGFRLAAEVVEPSLQILDLSNRHKTERAGPDFNENQYKSTTRQWRASERQLFLGVPVEIRLHGTQALENRVVVLPDVLLQTGHL